MTTRTALAAIALGLCVIVSGCGNSAEKQATAAKAEEEWITAEERAAAEKKADEERAPAERKAAEEKAAVTTDVPPPVSKAPTLDPWNDKVIVSDEYRTCLPLIAESTGLLRVWVARTEMPLLSHDATTKLGKEKPTGAYYTLIPVELKEKPDPLAPFGRIGKRKTGVWKTFHVRRFGRLLLAYSVTTADHIGGEPEFLGYDGSGTNAQQLDDTFRFLWDPRGNAALAEGVNPFLQKSADLELLHRLAIRTLEAGSLENARKMASHALPKAETFIKGGVKLLVDEKQPSIDTLAGQTLFSCGLIVSDFGSIAQTKAAFQRDDLLKPGAWPPLSGELAGGNTVRVVNPNDFAVKLAFRSGSEGEDLTVAAKGSGAVRLPSRRFDLYVQPVTEPKLLYQGESFTLEEGAMELQLMKDTGKGGPLRKLY